MTQQDEVVAEDLPEIPDGQEEDLPFVPQGDEDLSKTDSIDDELKRFKYNTGRNVLYVAMLVLVVLVGADIALSCNGVESTLTSNAFEVFKLIVMTVLGYIFGSSSSK